MSEQRFIRIVNWERFQHYKDRNPPWIKLHRELLTSRTWVTSDDASRVLAIALMMLAAATGNWTPADPAYIRRVAYLNQDPDFSQLLASQFIEIIDPASTLLADASSVRPIARPETEAETEADSPPLKESVFDLKENARARETKHYDPEVGLAIDLRKLANARKELELKLANGWGSGLTDRQIFEYQCAQAGISVQRGLEVSARADQWPDEIDLGAQAKAVGAH